MTFAAPTPGLRLFDDMWPRAVTAPFASTARPLPPPPPDAIPFPGPASWLRHVDASRLVVDPTRSAPCTPYSDSVIGREVADSFELIWPTGEIDDQYLGGPLWEVPPPDVRFNEMPSRIVPGVASAPMTVRLRPLAAPVEVTVTPPEPVSDDVVLAIQRAIAAIESDRVVSEAASVPVHASIRGLPDLLTRSTMPAHDAASPRAERVDHARARTTSDVTDERRSALKRLIGGLRRR
jgi:hypothetical protein